MRWGLLLVALSGCSLHADGLSPEDQNLGDGAIELDTSIADTTVVVPNDEGVADAGVEPDTTVVTDTAKPGSAKPDTTVLDTAMPDTFVADTYDAGCVALPIATPCANLPHYEKLATAQSMDGKADDFCDVPFVVFDNSTGAVRDPSPTPAEAKTTMTIRAAWSSVGLHLHLAVKDPKIIVATPASEKNLYLGDSVEIYVAGYDTLTGSYDFMTKDFGAQQIIIAPALPDGTIGTRAQLFYGGGPKGSPPLDRWASRNTADGYEIEVRLPWTDLKPTTMAAPVAGKKIALTLGFNNKYDATKQQAFSVYQVKTVASPVSGCTQPFCDDRYWCTPTLDP